MRESYSGLNTVNHTNAPVVPIQKRSYLAMTLSAVMPGLGQMYLNHFLKGCIILIVYISSIGIFYINSYPVRSWDDLLRFKPISEDTNTVDDTDRSIHLWTLDNGDALMFRPTWILKVTSFIQGLICLIYAIYDGWRGRQVFSPIVS